METRNNCSYWKCANSVGLFLVILFILCFIWYYIRPVEQELHLKLFSMTFLGFNDMSFVSFILGAIQSYIFAYIAMGIWWLVGCCKGSCQE